MGNRPFSTDRFDAVVRLIRGSRTQWEACVLQPAQRGGNVPRRSQVALTMLLTFLTFAATGRAQAPAARGNLVVTVVDPSFAVIPEATVTIVGLEDATKATAVPPAKTTPKGVVTF